MAKKTNEFTLITSIADSDTLTGVQGGVLDINITTAALKAKINALADAGGYFSTKTVEAALQQLGAAIAAVPVQYQPIDSDLTAIAALTTTTFGRGLLTVTDSNMMMSTINAQPADTDLTAIAALTTTAFGRSLLTMANGAAVLSAIGAQPVNVYLNAIAGSGISTFGQNLITQSDAPNARNLLGAAPVTNPTFQGQVQLQGGTNPNDAVNYTQLFGAAAIKVDKSALTNDGDLLTRVGGNPASVSRASLAQDTAFTSRFAAVGTSGPMGPAGPTGPAAPLVVKSTAPTAADYGLASIPLNAIWVVSP